MNPHSDYNHFEFTDINNMTLRGGSAAAPRSKRNVPYTAPRDLPNSTFGGTSLHHGTATMDLPNSMFGEITTKEGLFIGASAPVIIAGSAGFYALAGMASSWTQEFFIGNKRSLPWKTIAKRNGILGAVIGTIMVAGLAASLAAPEGAD